MRRISIAISVAVALVLLIGAGRAGLGTTAQDNPAATRGTLTGHPLVGSWLAGGTTGQPGSPPILTPSIFAADGSVVFAWPVTQAGPEGVTFASAWLGTWEPVDEHTGAFTAVQVHSDANGFLLGSVTVDGHPTVSEDGQTFLDDDAETTATIRDAAGAVVSVVSGDQMQPVIGTRMGVGSVVFPAATPAP